MSSALLMVKSKEIHLTKIDIITQNAHQIRSKMLHYRQNLLQPNLLPTVAKP